MSPTDLQADIERARVRLQAAEQEQSARERQIERPIPLAAARYHVARVVLWSFLGYAIAVGLFIMFCNEPTKTATLIDIMKTLLFPIVTLVIGFYFGSKAE